MSIAEKLITIADNEQKVFDAGVKEGRQTANKFINHGLLFDFRNYEGESIEVESDSALTYNITNTNTSNDGFCKNNQNLKKCIALFRNAISARCAFEDCHNLEEVTVDMTKITDTSDGYTGFNSTFRWCYALKRVEGKISLLNCDPENTFDRCDSLEYVAFVPSSINKSVNLTSCSNLSEEGIETLINGLVDISSGSAQTLSLHQTVISKLSTADIARITQKGWTLA